MSVGTFSGEYAWAPKKNPSLWPSVLPVSEPTHNYTSRVPWYSGRLADLSTKEPLPGDLREKEKGS